MITKKMHTKLEELAQIYANLTLQKRNLDAQLDCMKTLLTNHLEVGQQLVGDEYTLTIMSGRISQIWANDEVKKKIANAAVEKGLLKLEQGAPYPEIRFRGDVI